LKNEVFQLTRTEFIILNNTKFNNQTMSTANTTVKVIDSDQQIHHIPLRYCQTWSPIKHCLEAGLDESSPIPLMTVSTKSLTHLLNWYKHHDALPNPIIGEAHVNIAGKIEKKPVNPFDDDTFDRANDPTDLDTVENINQLSRWCLKEYTKDFFTNDWNNSWIESVSKTKKDFYDLISATCYLGCQVPLAIGAIFLTKFLDDANKQKQSEDTIRKLCDEKDDTVWIDNLPPPPVEEPEEESEEDEENEESEEKNENGEAMHEEMD
jgi:hypothetical protein